MLLTGPFFLILFEAGQIENEMHKKNRGRKSETPFFFGLRAARPTEVPKAFEAYTSLLQDLKKGFQ